MFGYGLWVIFRSYLLHLLSLGVDTELKLRYILYLLTLGVDTGFILSSEDVCLVGNKGREQVCFPQVAAQGTIL